jgi:hypothetical protein
VAGVVEGANVLSDARRLQRGAELGGVPLLIDPRAALGMAEDELVVALERSPLEVRGERVGEDRRERDRPLALLALRLDDAQRVLDEAEVASAQRQ